MFGYILLRFFRLNNWDHGFLGLLCSRLPSTTACLQVLAGLPVLEDQSRVDGAALRSRLITSEIEEAIRRLGRKKAERCDGISAEFLHALLGELLNQFIKLCKKLMKGEYDNQILKKVY